MAQQFPNRIRKNISRNKQGKQTVYSKNINNKKFTSSRLP